MSWPSPGRRPAAAPRWRPRTAASATSPGSASTPPGSLGQPSSTVPGRGPPQHSRG